MQQVEYVTHSNAFAWVREIQHPAVRLASKSTVRGGDEILSLGEFPRAFTSTYVEVASRGRNFVDGLQHVKKDFIATVKGRDISIPAFDDRVAALSLDSDVRASLVEYIRQPEVKCVVAEDSWCGAIRLLDESLLAAKEPIPPQQANVGVEVERQQQTKRMLGADNRVLGKPLLMLNPSSYGQLCVEYLLSDNASDDVDNHKQPTASDDVDNHKQPNASDDVDNHKQPNASDDVDNHKQPTASDDVDNHKQPNASDDVDNHKQPSLDRLCQMIGPNNELNPHVRHSNVYPLAAPLQSGLEQCTPSFSRLLGAILPLECFSNGCLCECVTCMMLTVNRKGTSDFAVSFSPFAAAVIEKKKEEHHRHAQVYKPLDALVNAFLNSSPVLTSPSPLDDQSEEIRDVVYISLGSHMLGSILSEKSLNALVGGVLDATFPISASSLCAHEDDQNEGTLTERHTASSDCAIPKTVISTRTSDDSTVRVRARCILVANEKVRDRLDDGLVHCPRLLIVPWVRSPCRLLQHRRLNFFLSHAGANSCHEALACGVPLVCRPFFDDQFRNAAMMRKRGSAIVLVADPHPQHQERAYVTEAAMRIASCERYRIAARQLQQETIDDSANAALACVLQRWLAAPPLATPAELETHCTHSSDG